jgi:hypothetical protein
LTYSTSLVEIAAKEFVEILIRNRFLDYLASGSITSPYCSSVKGTPIYNSKTLGQF